MAYYQRIRDLREDCDKKQSEIAEYLGTTTQYYGSYERGTTEIPFERAIALARYYSVSLDYIVGLTNDKRGLYADSMYSSLTQKQIDAISKLASVSPIAQDKKQLDKLITFLKELLILLEKN